MARSKFKKKIKKAWKRVPDWLRDAGAVLLIVVAVVVLVLYLSGQNECDKAVDRFEAGAIGLSVLADKCSLTTEYEQ